ncbi:hypothetical protein H4219_003364 [Mycoemilia scoparia]|uniref:non-specific serine/threonine protein kinase n=1 Tax=Mycoemilia scoparia TaxID=417184 RepID=A0A9W8A0S5_9FUNG|nr:hypothetical protein H4219_003364 [Mycoemilia scoparia]
MSLVMPSHPVGGISSINNRPFQPHNNVLGTPSSVTKVQATNYDSAYAASLASPPKPKAFSFHKQTTPGAGKEGMQSSSNTAAIPKHQQQQQQPRSTDPTSPSSPKLAGSDSAPHRRPSFMARFLGLDRPQKSATHSRNPSNASTTGCDGAEPTNTAGNTVYRAPSLAASARSNETAFAQKYGTCSRECIGRGATAIVRVAHKAGNSGGRMYAIKEFRRRRQNESERDYVKKLTSEFCVSSSLHHENIVETLDLIQDERKHWCQVMEFCPGGDLYTIIRDGIMLTPEYNCCFKQMVHGVAYMHKLGVAHRDVKPENLLLDTRYTIKLTDFGVADVFRTAWEKRTHKSRGLCGSEPYIAPEMFTEPTYDARKVDVWSCAIVYYTLVYHGIPWRVAKDTDSNYRRFLEAQKEGRDYEGFKKMKPEARRLIQSMLNPDPEKRPFIEDVLKDPWFASIALCNSEGRTPDGIEHNHYTEEYIDRRNYIRRRQNQQNRRDIR